MQKRTTKTRKKTTREPEGMLLKAATSPKQKGRRTRAQIENEIAGLRSSLPEPLKAPKIFLTDTTPEGLQRELDENAERSAVISDEGNLFDIMAGLYSDGKSNLDVFLQGHAGGPLRVKRSGRESVLQNISVTLGLAIQPIVISGMKTGKRQVFREKGLLGRFLPLVPQSNIGRRNVRKRTPVPHAVKSRYCAGMQSFLDITSTKTRRVTLTKDAREAWLDFAQTIEDEQCVGGKFDEVRDFTAKLPGQSLRIAALCHLAELQTENTSSSLSSLSPDVLEISAKTMQSAIKLCESLIPHAQELLSSLQNDAVVSDAKWVLNWIRKNVCKNDVGAYYIRHNELHRASLFKNSPVERVVKAMDILRERNIASSQFKLQTKKPTLIYYINPVILEDKTA